MGERREVEFDKGHVENIVVAKRSRNDYEAGIETDVNLEIYRKRSLFNTLLVYE